MEKLYSLTMTNEQDKSSLYIRKDSDSTEDSLLCKGDILDFVTYFNSFSLRKWKKYTNLQSLMLELDIQGEFEILVTLYSKFKTKTILKERISSCIYRRVWNVDEMQGDILGFSLHVLKDGSIFQGGAYYGEFSQWKNVKVGIGICTFKREEYVLKTINILKNFIRDDNNWLQVLVVDNGNTLEKQNKEGVRIIHNRNFGGSGGFTRAMIEYVEDAQVDYVLLMDDDIALEPSVLERSHSLLSGLKKEFQDSFLSGAMLIMERPTIQHENTAYWGKIRLHSFGQGIDLSSVKALVANECEHNQSNQYGAWWYSAIPLHRICEIGYPLPVFVKGDDMEYGIRNNRPLIYMNGVGVWHQSFATKMSPVVNYYSDRNMLIINQYAYGCNRLSLSISILGRLFKRIIKKDVAGIKLLNLAVHDMKSGFYNITKIPADEKLEQIKCYTDSRNLIKIVLNITGLAIKCFIHYNSINNDYKYFRNKELANACFWNKYLKIEE